MNKYQTQHHYYRMGQEFFEGKYGYPLKEYRRLKLKFPHLRAYDLGKIYRQEYQGQVQSIPKESAMPEATRPQNAREKKLVKEAQAEITAEKTHHFKERVKAQMLVIEQAKEVVARAEAQLAREQAVLKALVIE